MEHRIQSTDLWVFAYGSLMWNPEFEFVERLPARLHGYHRDFCVLSVVHRGTTQRPGLVLGLAPGGSCRGLAFRIRADQAAASIEALDARELVTSVYQVKNLPVLTPQGRYLARCYVCDTAHEQFAGRQDEKRQAQLIDGAAGNRGCNKIYLRETLAALEKIGIHDARLTRLAKLCEIKMKDDPS